MEGGQSEAALLEALVRDDESAVVPREKLGAVTALRDEDEDVAGVQVLLPLAADDGAQPVNRVAHVDGLRSQQDANGTGEAEHASADRREQLGQVAGVRADREADYCSAAEHRLNDAMPRPPR